MEVALLGALAQVSALLTLAMDIAFACAATSLWWVERRRAFQSTTALSVLPVRRPAGRSNARQQEGAKGCNTY